MSLDALPDISDVQVSVHTGWQVRPRVIERQGERIRSSPGPDGALGQAVPRADLLGDSYVASRFEDGTTLWARSRVDSIT